jgi:hypothetical protein
MAGDGDSSGEVAAGVAAGIGGELERLDVAEFPTPLTCSIIWAREIRKAVYSGRKGAEGTGRVPSVRDSPASIIRAVSEQPARWC